VSLIASLVLLVLAVLPLPASAWNIPGHMLSGAIAYQVLQQEKPKSIEKAKAVLEKHPWYANQWQARLQDVSIAERDQVLFMQSARWSDDIRIRDKAQNRPSWHYINLPFKPEDQPASVEIREPEPVNILTALAENERIVKNENDAERRAIALAWLFHLVGDIHQPLHAAQIFTVEYPKGDRGGNEICVRVTPAGQPMDLHRFWDGVITSSQNLTRLRNEATALRNRQEFQRSQLTELTSTDFGSWAKESFEIATKIAYRNGGLIGSPRDGNKDCTMIAAAPVLPVGCKSASSSSHEVTIEFLYIIGLQKFRKRRHSPPPVEPPKKLISWLLDKDSLCNPLTVRIYPSIGR
jgi:S1/P1 Nuclease